MRVIVFLSLLFLIFGSIAYSEDCADEEDCTEQEFSITVNDEIPRGSGNYTKTDVVEFILDIWKNLMPRINNGQRILMIMGLTGSGKSTLANYLNGIPLERVYRDKKWIIDLKKYQSERPGIGHTTVSKTIYPEVDSSETIDFKFVDNVAFDQNHGVGVEISNAFFTKQLTSFTQMKFLLLVTEEALEGRGTNFRQTVRRFSEFLGVFEKNDTTVASQSVGVVVTKVVSPVGVSDSEMKESFKKVAMEILKQELRSKEINKMTYKVLNEVLTNNQIEVFSNPQEEGILNNEDKDRIISMLGRMEYIKEADVEVRTRLQDKHRNHLLKYLADQVFRFQEQFIRLFNKAVSDYFEDKLTTMTSVKDAIILYLKIQRIFHSGCENNYLFDFIQDIRMNYLDDTTRDQLFDKDFVLKYLHSLLPKESQETIPQKIKWVDHELKSKLHGYIDRLVKYFRDQYEEFVGSVKGALDKSMYKHYTKFTENKTVSQATIVYKLLEELADHAKAETDFKTFINNLNEEILSNDEKERLLSVFYDLEEFIAVLPEDHQTPYTENRKWMDYDQLAKIEFLLRDLVDYFKKEYSQFEESIFTTMDGLVDAYHHEAREQLHGISDAREIYVVLSDLMNNDDYTNDLESFLNVVNVKIMNEVTKATLLEKFAEFKQFNELLKESDRVDLTVKKDWIDSNLREKIETFIAKVLEYLKEQFALFIQNFNDVLVFSVNTTYTRLVHNFTSLDHVKAFKTLISTIRDEGKKELDFMLLLDYISEKILDKERRDDLVARFNMLYEFIDLLQENNREGYKKEQVWLNYLTLSVLDEILKDIEKYVIEYRPVFLPGRENVFSYKGMFAKISDIVKEINNAEYITNLTNVTIMTLFTVTFDSDFKIYKGRYQNRAPTLFVRTQRIIVDSNVTIDLSCELIPSYPDKKEKAENGVERGEKGVDGKPGLMGCDGGNFSLNSDIIIGLENIKFISNGGEGGPGQNGGDGVEGKKGDNQLVSDVSQNDILYMTEIVDRTEYAKINVTHYYKPGHNPGSRGGDAGKGGCGGKGGKGGSFKYNGSKQNANSENGKNGKNGSSGVPGIGGMYGDLAIRGFCKQILTKRGKECQSNRHCSQLLLKQKETFCKLNYTKIVISGERDPDFSGSIFKILNCETEKRYQYRLTMLKSDSEIVLDSLEQEYQEFKKSVFQENKVSVDSSLEVNQDLIKI